MSNSQLKFSLIACIVLAWNFLSAQQDRIAISGLWNDASTWTGTGIPENDTRYIIPFGDTVVVNCNCGVYANTEIEVYGVLHFPSGRKINLDASGKVTVFESGALTANNNGDKLIIDGVPVWEGKEENIVGTTICDQSGCYSSAVLPVELTRIQLFHQGQKQFRLDWQTASEFNNDFFSIEYSSNFDEWEEVALIQGAGNSQVSTSYSHSFVIDHLNNSGYLRLRQTDFDGVVENLFQELINSDGKRAPITYELYPNPSRGKIFISSKTDRIHQVNLVHLATGITSTQRLIDNYVDFNIIGYSGTYWLQAIGEQGEPLFEEAVVLIN